MSDLAVRKANAQPIYVYSAIREMAGYEREIPPLYDEYMKWRRAEDAQNRHEYWQDSWAKDRAHRDELECARVPYGNLVNTMEDDTGFCISMNYIWNDQLVREVSRIAAKVCEGKMKAPERTNATQPNLTDIREKLISDLFSTPTMQDEPSHGEETYIQKLTSRATTSKQLLDVISTIVGRMVYCAQYGLFEADVIIPPFFDEKLKKIFKSNKFKVEFTDDESGKWRDDTIYHAITVKWNRKHPVMGALSQAFYDEDFYDVLDALLNDVENMLNVVLKQVEENLFERKLCLIASQRFAYNQKSCLWLSLPLLKLRLQKEGISCSYTKKDERYILSLSW